MTFLAENNTQECQTVSVDDAAMVLGYKRQTVYNAIKAGKVQVIRLSPRRMRISKKEIKRILDGGIL